MPNCRRGKACGKSCIKRSYTCSKPVVRDAGPTCKPGKSYPCGNTCLPVRKNCTKAPGTARWPNGERGANWDNWNNNPFYNPGGNGGNPFDDDNSDQWSFRTPDNNENPFNPFIDDDWWISPITQ